MQRGDIEKIKEKLNSDGYVIVPNVFSCEDIEFIKAFVLKVIKSVVEKEAPQFLPSSNCNHETEILMILTRINYECSEIAKRIRGKIISSCGYAVPDILEKNQNLRFVVEKILRLSSYSFSLFLISICLPKSSDVKGGLLGWHQDFGGAGMYAIWSPIVEHENYKNGYLNFISGNFPHLPHSVISENYYDVNTISEDDLPSSVPEEVYCRIGDVIIWNDLTLHATRENLSNISRYALITWVSGLQMTN